MKKKIFTLLVLLAAVVTGAYAAVPDKVYYRVYDYSDGKLTYTDNEIAGTGVTEVTSATTEWENGTYVVTATTTISSRITVTGTVNLIIFDGATLTAEKGITVSDDNTLNIYMGNSSNSIQSTGQLNATALEGMDYSTHNEFRIQKLKLKRIRNIGRYQEKGIWRCLSVNCICPVIMAQVQVILLSFAQIGSVTAAHGNLPGGMRGKPEINHTAVICGIDSRQKCAPKTQRDDPVFTQVACS